MLIGLTTTYMKEQKLELFDHIDVMHKISLLTNKRTEMFGFNADEYQGKDALNG